PPYLPPFPTRRSSDLLSERKSSPYGPQVHGGFDCSGFVWRVYKLERYAGEAGLADMLQGRTTYAMAGEVPKAKRIALDKLQPAADRKSTRLNSSHQIT